MFEVELHPFHLSIFSCNCLMFQKISCVFFSVRLWNVPASTVVESDASSYGSITVCLPLNSFSCFAVLEFCIQLWAN